VRWLSVAGWAIPWYENSMKGVAKVAVSIPRDTLRSLERARARLRKTRSAAVTEAIEKWLRAEQVGEDDRRYVEGYLRHPEQSGETAAVAEVAAATWERWE
jgi:metal-responsive CopG/Arc/MetJ family transcriptional regulator